MAQLDAGAASCGYTSYFDEHVTYPPKGLLPLPGNSTEGDRGCRFWDEIFEAALLINPAFDIYRIFDTVPYSWLIVAGPINKGCSIQSCGTY